MAIWYKIRQHVGLALLSVLIWIVIIAAHAIPEFVVSLITN